LFLVVDLARRHLPWIITGIPEKYASNPVIDLFREKPYTHRVAIFPMDRYINLEAVAAGQRARNPGLRLAGPPYNVEWKPAALPVLRHPILRYHPDAA